MAKRPDKIDKLICSMCGGECDGKIGEGEHRCKTIIDCRRRLMPFLRAREKAAYERGYEDCRKAWNEDNRLIRKSRDH